MASFTDDPIDLEDSLVCEPGGNQLVKKKKRAAYLTPYELMESIIENLIKENAIDAFSASAGRFRSGRWPDKGMSPPTDRRARRSLEALEAGFDSLFRDRRKRSLFVALTHANASVLLRAGLNQFKEKGNADRLDLLGMLLNAMGHSCFPALLEISVTPSEAQQVFVDLIVQADFLDHDERAILVEGLASSSEVETKLRLLDVLHRLNSDLRGRVLTQLAGDDDPEIRATVEELSRAFLAIKLDTRKNFS